MLRAQSFITEITDEFMPKKKPGVQVSQPKMVKVLVVTHGGFIGEFLNVVRMCEGR